MDMSESKTTPYLEGTTTQVLTEGNDDGHEQFMPITSQEEGSPSHMRGTRVLVQY